MSDLETGKVYQVIKDNDALRSGMVRIIDASGEDYLYPSDWFVPLNLTRIVNSVILARQNELFSDRKPIVKGSDRTQNASESNPSAGNARNIRNPKRTPVVKNRTS